MAAANAAGSSGGTSKPVSPSRTASGTPPAFPATTGSPHADASTSEMPKPSTPIRSARREAPTYTAGSALEDRRERLQHRVDALVRLEARHGEQPARSAGAVR